VFFGTIDGNGPASPATREQLDSIVTEFVTKMHSIKCGCVLLLHFDDVQVMASEINFERGSPEAIVEKIAYCNYYLIALTMVLEEIRTNVHIKAAVTGTNIFQDKMIRVGSEVS
jgi:hypothetical protein